MFSHGITVTLTVGFILGIKAKLMNLTQVRRLDQLSMVRYDLRILANCIASYWVTTQFHPIFFIVKIFYETNRNIQEEQNMLTVVLVTSKKKYLSKTGPEIRLPDKILKASMMSKIASRATTVINATVSLWPVRIGLPILYEIWPVSSSSFYFFPISTAHILVSYEVPKCLRLFQVPLGA